MSSVLKVRHDESQQIRGHDGRSLEARRSCSILAEWRKTICISIYIRRQIEFQIYANLNTLVWEFRLCWQSHGARHRVLFLDRKWLSVQAKISENTELAIRIDMETLCESF